MNIKNILATLAICAAMTVTAAYSGNKNGLADPAPSGTTVNTAARQEEAADQAAVSGTAKSDGRNNGDRESAADAADTAGNPEKGAAYLPGRTRS